MHDKILEKFASMKFLLDPLHVVLNWYFLEIIGADRRYYGKIGTFCVCVVLFFGFVIWKKKKNLENVDDIDMRKKKEDMMKSEKNCVLTVHC